MGKDRRKVVRTEIKEDKKVSKMRVWKKRGERRLKWRKEETEAERQSGVRN